jgi:hypothetical protein
MGTAAPGAESAGQALLRDGLALISVEGKVTVGGKAAEGRERGFWGSQVWRFTLGADVSDDRSTVKAGTKLELLPSATLEKIIADMSEYPQGTYRLWGKVTKYRGRNYIFPEFFFPIIKTPGKVETPEPPAEPREAAKPKEPNEPNKPPAKPKEQAPKEEAGAEKVLADPNGVLKIPKEILEKLKDKKPVQPRRLKPKPKTKKKVEQDLGPDEKIEKNSEPAKRRRMELDSALADRTAVLVKQDNGRSVFTLDALGRNVQDVSLRLLPCESLELTELRQTAAVERVRFKIAGIKTKYKGRYYLLLQKATQVYSHGNFGR